MQHESFVLGFAGASTAEANRYASDLVGTLRGLDQSLTAEQQRNRDDTQDFGSTVVLILGTASITALAKGVAAWLARHSGARLEISAEGRVVATNLDSRDAAKIAEAFAGRK